MKSLDPPVAIAESAVWHVDIAVQ